MSDKIIDLVEECEGRIVEALNVPPTDSLVRRELRANLLDAITKQQRDKRLAVLMQNLNYIQNQLEATK